MPPTPKAVRVKTAAGWQDIALQGAQGPPGPMRELAVVMFGGVTASAAPGTLFADFGTVTYDGEAVIVEVAAGFIDLRTNSNAVIILYDFITGSDVQVARIAYWREAVTTDSGGQWFPVHVSFRFTPTAGNHRYRLKFQTDVGYAGISPLDAPPNFARIVKASPIAPASLVNPPPDSNKISIKRPGPAVNGVEQGPITGVYELFASTIGDLRHAITPSVNVWWECEQWTICRVIDAVWYGLDSEIRLLTTSDTSQADVLGQTKGQTMRTINHSGAQPWNTARAQALFKLSAGITYIAQPVIQPTAGSWVWLNGQLWTGTSSKVVGYW